MHEVKIKLRQTGEAILNDSKTQLYVSMRFLDIALNSLDFTLDLSTKTIGTDSQSIRFNPRYLIECYKDSETMVNRAYLHMLLHCIFGHMFQTGDKEKELWDLSCDIAVMHILDEMDISSVRQVTPDERQEMYDRLQTQMKVLTAEGIYRFLKEHPMTWLEMEKIRKFFAIDDHCFWEMEENEKRASSENGDNQDNSDNSDNSENETDENHDGGDSSENSPHDKETQENEDSEKKGKNQRQEEQKQHWQEITQKLRTNMETYEKTAAEKAGGLYDYIRIVTRERYNYSRFLKKFTTLREEIRLDMDSYDYIYYTYGLEHYTNMPLIEALEYKEVKKIEELAIVIDTSESCSGDLAKRFLEETFTILSDKEHFFRHMHIHIIQCDAMTQSDTVITCEKDMAQYMENFRLNGFGGTDFRPAFDYVNRLCREKVFKNLKGLIYFTDGYGTYPKERPRYQTAFVFLEENFNDRHVPPWAIKVVLGSEDLMMAEGRR